MDTKNEKKSLHVPVSSTSSSFSSSSSSSSSSAPPLPEQKRLPSYSFDSLVGQFKEVEGKSYINPRPHDTIPKLHDRKATYDLYTNQNKMIFYHVNIEPIGDDLWATNTCTNGASFHLKLLNLRPFFYASVQPDRTDPDEDDAKELMERLNRREFWPPRFVPTSKDEKPITSIEVLELKNVPGQVEIDGRTVYGYPGRDPKTGKRRRSWQYRLNFYNMSCWRHYRDLIRPLRKHEKSEDKWENCFNKAKLKWQPKLNHERHYYTYIQMLFNMNPFAPKTWLEMNIADCKFTPLDADDSFGGYGDTEWTETELEKAEEKAQIKFDEYTTYKNEIQNEDELSSEEENDQDEEDKKSDDDDRDNKPKPHYESKKKKHKKKSRKWGEVQQLKSLKLRKKKAQLLEEYQECRKTRAVIEGEIDYSKLKRRTDIIGAGPLTEVIFDIETGSGKQIRYTLQGRIKPPIPDDEPAIDEKDQLPMDSIDDYKDLLDRIQDKKMTEEELNKMLPQLEVAKMSNINKRWFAGAQGKKRLKKGDTKQRSIFSFVESKTKTEEQEQLEEKKTLNKRKDLYDAAQKKEQIEIEKRKALKRKREEEKQNATSSSSSSSSSSFTKDPKKDAKKETEFKPQNEYPDPNNPEDPITVISTKVRIYGDEEFFLSVLHSWRPAKERKELKNTIKFRWTKPDKASEWAMLSHWSHMIASQLSTEFLWQYNGIGYDIPYMYIRANYLDCARFMRLGCFLALPHEKLFDEHRYNQCVARVVGKPGRSIYRRDENGNEKENEFDFPGIRIHIPGLYQPDVYRTMKAMTFNTLEFGTLRYDAVVCTEVTKKYTKCRCKGWVIPDRDSYEEIHKLCGRCGHIKEKHCQDYVESGKPDKCKQCGREKKAHNGKTDGCKSKEGPRKRDLKGVLITPFACTDDHYRAIEEFYCSEDVTSTGEVGLQNQMTPHLTELSCVTLTNINDLMTRGQTKKTWNQLVFAAHKNQWLCDEKARQYMQYKFGVIRGTIPDYAKTHQEKDDEREASNKQTKAEKQKGRLKYTGGYVTDPLPGIYNVIINTLDWNSLYPSLIIAHNLCWSSWIDHQYDELGRIYFPLYGTSPDDQDHSQFLIWRLEDLKPTPEQVGNRDLVLVVEDWGDINAAKWTAYQLYKKMAAMRPVKAPHQPDKKIEFPAPPEWKPQPGQKPKATCCFVVNCESMFPPILKNLLDGRSRVKKLQKKAVNDGDFFTAGVYEAQQLALKLCGNAGYGFTGAVDGPFGGVPIACATCLLGRHYEMVSAWTALFDFYMELVYGDTDSIFNQCKMLQERYSYEVTKVALTIERAWKDVQGKVVGPLDMKPEDYEAWRKKVDQAYTDFDTVQIENGDEKKFLKKKVELAQKYVELVCRKAILEQGQVCSKIISERIQEMLNSRTGGSIESTSIALNQLHKENKLFVTINDLNIAVGNQCASVKLPDAKPIDLQSGREQVRALLDELKLLPSNLWITDDQIDRLIVASGNLDRTMNLELEKQMNRAIFFRRKMYAFRFCWPDSDDGKIKPQGIAGKRRDNNILIRNAYMKTIEELLTCDIEILKYASASFLQPKNQPKPKVAKSLKTTLAEAARAASKEKDAKKKSTESKKKKDEDMDVLDKFDRLFDEVDDPGQQNDDVGGWLQGAIEDTKTEAKEAVKKTKAQVVRPSFDTQELEKIIATEKGREKVKAATDTLLRFYKEANDRLMAITDEYEELQRTAAVNEGYTNERQAQVQAIRKAERRRKVKMEVGQRIGYIMGKPDKIKAKNVTSNALTYEMNRMYANSVETSQAQQDLTEPHKMYYLLFGKKKLTQALSLVMPAPVVNRFTAPYAGEIYRKDFGFSDLKKWMDDNKHLVPKKRKRMDEEDDSINKDEFHGSCEKPDQLIHDDDDDDDDDEPEPDFE